MEEMSRDRGHERLRLTIWLSIPRQSGWLKRSANTRYWVVGRAGAWNGYIKSIWTSRLTHLLLQVRVEPGQGAFDDIAAVLGVGEHVAFVFVDYELRFDTEGF
jgi:hypothetical protein